MSQISSVRKIERKRAKARTNGTTHSIAPVHWDVVCNRHGMKITGENNKKIKVSPPSNKRERLYTGCPTCK